VSEAAKVVSIEEFKRRDPDNVGRVLLSGPAAPFERQDPRQLKPNQIAHRFAMLAYLRQAK
jgi:hypothetical protein